MASLPPSCYASEAIVYFLILSGTFFDILFSVYALLIYTLLTLLKLFDLKKHQIKHKTTTYFGTT